MFSTTCKHDILSVRRSVPGDLVTARAFDINILWDTLTHFPHTSGIDENIVHIHIIAVDLTLTYRLVHVILTCKYDRQTR